MLAAAARFFFSRTYLSAAHSPATTDVQPEPGVAPATTRMEGPCEVDGPSEGGGAAEVEVAPAAPALVGRGGMHARSLLTERQRPPPRPAGFLVRRGGLRN